MFDVISPMKVAATLQQRRWLAPALLAISLIPGCAPLGAIPDQIHVTSEPPGAEVYVMGEKAGVTPLNVNQSAVFPPRFPAEKQSLYGNIELRKAGCKNSIQRVSTGLVTKGVHVRLECDETAGAGKAESTGASIESRLRRVQELRDKGLITDQEAREIRQRILNGL